MELLIGYLKTCPLEMGGGEKVGKSTNAINGVVSRVLVHTMGGWGVKFLSFWCIVTN